MANKIQFKRGASASLPTLSAGEPGFTTDTKKLYIGASGGNVAVAMASDLTAKANLASPALTGTPTAPTNSTASTSNTQIATTAFVHAAILADTDSALSSSSTKPLQNKAINTALGLKANLASPTFTGTPKAPTAVSGTNTTQIATTAFTKTEIDARLNRTTAVNVEDTNYGTVMARGSYAGTTDLTAGTSDLTSGVLYFYYEA